MSRLELVEAQLRAVSDHVLVRAGDRLGAIKKYRELVGGGVEEARAAVAAL